MRMRRLLVQSLRFYWRSHVAVGLGVATAVSVLAGALLVGDSVRGSLRDLVLGRLGRADLVVASSTFFGEPLGAAIQEELAAVAPLIVTPGFVTAQQSGRRLGGVRVYGVDDRFWGFHGVAGTSGPADREAFLSPALARELGVGQGDAILVRVQRPTDIPLESLFGRKDDLGRTLRLTVRTVQPATAMGEFSLEPGQGDVRAVFAPLARVQQELDAPGRVNTLLVASRPGASDNVELLTRAVRAHTDIEDLGWRVTPLSRGDGFSVGSDSGVLDDTHAAAAVAAGAGLTQQPMFTYLANTLRVGDREVPYSLVTAIDLAPPGNGAEVRTDAPVAVPTGASGALGRIAASTSAEPLPPITLTEWTATQLRARVGDTLAMDYFLWEEPGRLATRTTEFAVTAIVPVSTGDREMAPTLPGISDAATLNAWNPPFPVDLRRVRPVDEAYWAEYRTTPKAFVPLAVGQRLWRSTYGAVTSIRMAPVAAGGDDARAFLERLRAGVDPLALGLAVRDVRAEGLLASRGATDFGEYFLYFSAFLVVSALLLAVLFFKLGVEQRAREVGLLRALGFGPSRVRRLFTAEGAAIAVAGSVVGAGGALVYAWLVIAALRSWWFDAVGTTALTLHVAPASLAIGVAGGIVAAIVCIGWTLRSLAHVTERGLLTGHVSLEEPGRPGARGWPARACAAALTVIALGLLFGASTGRVDAAGGFFGAGAALLVAALLAARLWLASGPRRANGFDGWQPVLRLGMRSASYRPGRSLLAIAVIASATFIIVSVDGFRRGTALADAGRQSGVGGYSLIVETVLPVAHDPNSREGRDALNLFSLGDAGASAGAEGTAGVRIEPFRLRPGDDASCLNLYQPRNPRILAPRDSFLDEGRFAFQGSLAETEADRANPWRLLMRVEPDGAIPVIADANSMTYVLHHALGEEMVLTVAGRPVRLRFVAALQDSVFQGELLMGQANFARLFPEVEGTRVFLVETVAPDDAKRGAQGGVQPVAASGAESRLKTPDELTALFEDAWVDLGGDATPTSARLAQFHRVENTYLSTFQTLGGLGLLLGTIGLATVLLRNVLERRKELALLGAVGYRVTHVRQMIVAENALLLAAGLAIGALCAALAIAPAVAARGGTLPVSGGGVLLLLAVFATGLLSSAVALRVATRTSLLAALRSE